MVGSALGPPLSAPVTPKLAEGTLPFSSKDFILPETLFQDEELILSFDQVSGEFLFTN